MNKLDIKVESFSNDSRLYLYFGVRFGCISQIQVREKLNVKT